MKPLFAQDTKKLDSLSPFAISTGMPPAVLRPAAVTVIVSDADIENLGASAMAGASSQSKKMLAAVRASDADAFGAKLLQLTSVTQEMRTLVTPGLLARVTGAFRNGKNSLMSRYDSIDSRLTTLVQDMDREAHQKRSRIPELEELYVANFNRHQQLEADISHAQTVFLPALTHELQGAAESGGSFAVQQQADIQTKIARLDKKIDDLQRVMLLAKQFAPQVRMIQDNARTLASQFDSVKLHSIPAWRDVFVTYIIQLEQKAGAAVIHAIHDTTDSAFRMQADLLRQNSSEIAKATQRSIVSTETIQHSHEQLMGTLKDLESIEAESKQSRKLAEPLLKQLEQELLLTFTPKQ